MSRFEHPRMVTLGVTCYSEEDVLKAFEVLARIAAGLTVDGFETEIGSYSYGPTDDDDEEDEFSDRREGEAE